MSRAVTARNRIREKELLAAKAVGLLELFAERVKISCAIRQLSPGVYLAYNVRTRGAMPATAKKEHRIHLRASERDVSTISRAAASEGVSLSAFILESAAERAGRTLADQRQFVLTSAQWRAFTDALDRPAQRKPRLEKLLREPSILEQA